MYTKNLVCRICTKDTLTCVLPLGDQALANAFLTKKQLEEGDELVVPLDVYWCSTCSLTQLIDVVDKEVLFRNYIYFSSGMPKLSDHFKNYAEDVMERFLQQDDFVVEIASNDGILLKFFQEKGYRVLGVDPATNVVKIAEQRGVPTLNDFFSESLASTIKQTHGGAKAIMANNVVAHIDDHHDLARGIAALLEHEGVFVFEAPYLIDMFENLAYDTVYHEHLSFLAIRPLQVLFAQYGLEIFDVHMYPVQGNSIRVFVGNKGVHTIEPAVDTYVQKERAFGLDTLQAYRTLAKRVESSKNQLIQLVTSLKAEGRRLAAYGAPAKGNTLLNYCQIGTDILDYALDDLPSKQGLYTPGMHIPVVGREYAEAHAPEYYVLLAWNYAKPILEKEKEFRARGGKFIIPIGDTIEIV